MLTATKIIVGVALSSTASVCYLVPVIERNKATRNYEGNKTRMSIVHTNEGALLELPSDRETLAYGRDLECEGINVDRRPQRTIPDRLDLVVADVLQAGSGWDYRPWMDSTKKGLSFPVPIEHTVANDSDQLERIMCALSSLKKVTYQFDMYVAPPEAYGDYVYHVLQPIGATQEGDPAMLRSLDYSNYIVPLLVEQTQDPAVQVNFSERSVRKSRRLKHKRARKLMRNN